ncbi:MAG TPA: pitrilysin family protein [Acidobacteriota bacterium]|nr:pitrilysin family protein [Acidobacteriota bacterium]
MTRVFMLFILILPLLVFAAESQKPDENVVLIKNDSPLIAFRILFRTGSAYDPKGKEGLAALTASMIAEGGTQKNKYEKILELLFPLAASYSAQVDKEMVVITGVTHKDNIQAFYELFRDAVLSPGFATDDFERLKTDQVNAVANTLRYNDDEELGKETLNAEIFKNHRYGHPEAGTVTSAKSLTLEDVKQFYAQQFTRKNLVIGIAGDYPDTLATQIKNDFSALPAGSESNSAGKIESPTAISGQHAVLIEKDTAGTAISFGFPIPVTRSDEDFYPMLVMNAWLGQHRSSFGHLFQVMRELRGLNYGDYSYIEHYPFGGFTMQPFPNFARRQQIFQVWIRPVQNQNRHFALRQAIREIQKLIDNGMTQEEFEGARNFLANYTVSLAQSNSEQLGYALDDRFYGLKQPYLEKIKTKLANMRVEDVNPLIKKYFNTKNMIIAVVTEDAASFKKALAENTPSPIQYESPKPESVTEDDKQIINYPLNLSEENIRIVPVDKIFE